MNKPEHDIRNAVLEAIRKNAVSMRPRWHFLLLSTLLAAGMLLLLFTLLYVTSLAIFIMRESGVWYAPAFGGQGWFELLRAMPLFLIALIAFCAVLLEMLARRYSWVYRRPLMASLGGVLIVVLGGSFALAQTSLHKQLAYEAKRGAIPVIGMWYGDHSVHGSHGTYRGVVVSPEMAMRIEGVRAFVIFNEYTGTSTVFITSKTRLPYGEDFGPGDYVVIMGDTVATNTIRAFGVRKVE